MHESVLMSKPVSSLILLILFVKCLWAPGVALIPSAKGNPSPPRKKKFPYIRWALLSLSKFRTKPLCGAPPEQMHPPDSFPHLLLPWSQREPTGQQFTASCHS